LIIAQSNAINKIQKFAIPGYIQPTALLILGYPKNGFLDTRRNMTQSNPIGETVMMEEYVE
jgi:hypothetical protein